MLRKPAKRQVFRFFDSKWPVRFLPALVFLICGFVSLPTHAERQGYFRLEGVDFEPVVAMVAQAFQESVIVVNAARVGRSNVFIGKAASLDEFIELADKERYKTSQHGQVHLLTRN